APMSGHACGAANEPCSKASVLRNEFPGDILPANRINPVGLKILSYYPAPNTTGMNNNFIASGNVGRYRYDQPMARWDHVFSASDKIYTLVTFQHGSEYRDSTGFGPPAGSGDVGSERTDQNYIAAWTHVLSPTAVFDVRGSYARFTSMFPRYTDFNLTADKLGITQVFHAPTYSKNTVPVIQVDWNESAYLTRPYVGLYVQDDWRIRPSVTINVGLRYDVQIPWLERFNRVNRGFDLTTRTQTATLSWQHGPPTRRVGQLVAGVI